MGLVTAGGLLLLVLLAAHAQAGPVVKRVRLGNAPTAETKTTAGEKGRVAPFITEPCSCHISHATFKLMLIH